MLVLTSVVEVVLGDATACQLIHYQSSQTLEKDQGMFLQTAMGSQMSPIGANFYLEEVDSRALSSFKGTTLNNWFRYMWMTPGQD